MITTLGQKASHFRSLHSQQRPLALSNAWDVASALIAEAAGATAIATTSAGVAWSLGRRDGDHLDRAQAVSVVAAITSAVKVPVTADIEGGYADTQAGIATTVEAILEAGAVGINIEDGTRTPAELAARLVIARKAADSAGISMFINARTDVFLAAIGPPEKRLSETITRAQRYVDAGADGIFVPGVVEPETVSMLVAGINAPLNLMVGPGTPSVAELGQLGVSRVSLGPSVALAAYATVQRTTARLMDTGTYGDIAEAIGYEQLNGLFAAR